MKDILNVSEIARADVYAQYLLGWAYIPIQDLPKYEKAYEKVKINNKRGVKYETYKETT